MQQSTSDRDVAEATFERVAQALGIDPGGDENEWAHDFWIGMADPVLERGDDAWNRECTRLEEVLVWRVVADRMVRQLGREGIFQIREKGVGAGTAVLHPAVDGLAKTFERLRKTMNDLFAHVDDAAGGGPVGFPDMMKALMEENEGVLEEILGTEPGPEDSEETHYPGGGS